MSESVVADFVGRFYTEDVQGGEPVKGRVLLSKKRLVLAREGGKTTIPLSGIFDVSVGFVPGELAEFFDDTVTLAYETRGQKHTAVVEGRNGNVDRFTTVLFKVLLNGTTVRVKHPDRVGGRVTDASTTKAKLSLKPQSVKFVGERDSFTIDLAAVSNIERTTRQLGGKTQPVLEISHLDGGQALVSVVAVPSGRKTNIFGRYVRLEYGSIQEEVGELDHSEEELEALVALYSTGGSANLGTLLNAEPAQITMVLNSLHDDGLVVDGDGATKLTPKGRVAVTTHLERVNA
ncbi:HTH domain-containing protein [Halogranum gelatinilyticum]|uniref:Taxis protein CheF n=1 Tax=Halogranum gelatinilyticum TaxID=660521 RepID=A0A1G9R2V5_9EURY|nr:CheF family chemotaxis protein [Halogranum gelatinilyticum]SDM17579.1 HTH domain-containing protein [Halogranum gelatinilyticum]